MVQIVPMRPEHWPQVAAIYSEGIATGHATFEAEPPSWEQFDADKARVHRWVAVDEARHANGENAVLGWAAASPVSDRCAYAGVVEHSVYVASTAGGRGIGLTLLNHLTSVAESAGIWTVQSGIFPENEASLRLHERAGFRTVGVRRGVGRMTYGPAAGRWRDVVFVEWRSAIAGTA
ncbi:N-acetyltransferase [Dermacoccus abyssi]|uniref:N-acetyltransferase n=1 Tax=Dermacoccus abyssi TaxID=322596 RepID=A0ABX5Z5A3_9MICO|nr:N-acetyltransferase [Dermacoccus abyssi]